MVIRSGNPERIVRDSVLDQKKIIMVFRRAITMFRSEISLFSMILVIQDESSTDFRLNMNLLIRFAVWA